MSTILVPDSCHIQMVNWADHKKLLCPIRQTVFIEEQKVPAQLEWDEQDESAQHILAQIEYKQQLLPVGTARILIRHNIASIGRMAVLPQWRRFGIGYKILSFAVSECQKQQMIKIILNAQSYVLNFYLKAGFKISSNEFFEAGIAHKQMTLTLIPEKNDKS